MKVENEQVIIFNFQFSIFNCDHLLLELVDPDELEPEDESELLLDVLVVEVLDDLFVDALLDLTLLSLLLLDEEELLTEVPVFCLDVV